MKKGMLFVIMIRMFGIVILWIGLNMVISGVKEYYDQWHQEDWVTTIARVSDVVSEYSYSSKKIIVPFIMI